MKYKDEMKAKWEQYETMKERGEDTSAVKEEMLDLTDKLKYKNPNFTHIYKGRVYGL